MKALFFLPILLILNLITSFAFAENTSNDGVIQPELPVPDITKMTPLKQVKLGLVATSVFCKKGFQLMIKTNDGSPACLRPYTVQKLVERGWGKLQEQTFGFVYNLMACKESPWYQYWNEKYDKIDNMTTYNLVMQRGVILKYFEAQGITILDAKIQIVRSEGVPVCGITLVSEYYFLVFEHDKDKMIKLGYELYPRFPPQDFIPIG